MSSNQPGKMKREKTWLGKLAGGIGKGLWSVGKGLTKGVGKGLMKAGAGIKEAVYEISPDVGDFVFKNKAINDIVDAGARFVDGATSGLKTASDWIADKLDKNADGMGDLPSFGDKALYGAKKGLAMLAKGASKAFGISNDLTKMAQDMIRGDDTMFIMMNTKVIRSTMSSFEDFGTEDQMVRLTLGKNKEDPRVYVQLKGAIATQCKTTPMNRNDPTNEKEKPDTLIKIPEASRELNLHFVNCSIAQVTEATDKELDCLKIIMQFTPKGGERQKKEIIFPRKKAAEVELVPNDAGTRYTVRIRFKKHGTVSTKNRMFDQYD